MTVFREGFSADPIKRLAQEASDLHGRLYYESVAAAVAGDLSRYQRLRRLQERAMSRYERRYAALRRQ